MQIAASYIVRPLVSLTCRIIAITVALLSLSMALLRYYNLETSILDLGVYDNLAWRFAAYGEWLPSFSSHFRPITLLYGLVYKILPHPFTLIFLQWSAAVGAGLIFYRITKHLLDTSSADVLICLYALNPIVLYQIFWDFHTDHLIVIIFFAIFYILVIRDDLNKIDKISIVALSCLTWLLKEPLILSIAFMGLFIAAYKKEWILGLGIFISSMLAFYLINNFLMPYYRVQDVFLDGSYANINPGFNYLGGNVNETVSTLLTQPGIVFNAIFNDVGKIIYLAVILLPVAFLPLTSPAVLLPALPAIALSLLSTNPNHYAPVHHYTAPIIAPLFLSTVLMIQRIKLNGASTVPFSIAIPVKLINLINIQRILIMMTMGTILTSWAYSPLPLSRSFFRANDKYHYSAYFLEPRDQLVKAALATIPNDSDVSVTIQNNVMYHPLTQRMKYYVFPRNIETSDYIVIDLTQMPYISGEVQELDFRNFVDELYTTSKVISDNDGLVIFKN
jgi:uncharacterized membrane protein